MENLELKVIEFDSNDVIATSGVFTLSGADDGELDNLSFNGPHTDSTEFHYMTGGNDSYWTWADLYHLDASNDPDTFLDGSNDPDQFGAQAWNGDYTWDGEKYIHQ